MVLFRYPLDVLLFFFLCSDIDLVICGKWPTLPFGDLSEALQHVAKPGSLKVLERAAVSLSLDALKLFSFLYDHRTYTRSINPDSKGLGFFFVIPRLAEQTTSFL